jgi:hypothetical protein
MSDSGGPSDGAPRHGVSCRGGERPARSPATRPPARQVIRRVDFRDFGGARRCKRGDAVFLEAVCDAEGIEEKAAVAIGCSKVQFCGVADDVVHICVVVPVLSTARRKS